MYTDYKVKDSRQ